MDIRGLFVLAGAVLLWGQASAAAAASSCKQTQYASLSAEITEDGAVVLPVGINGRSAYVFLDMSQGVPLIFKGAVDYLGLKTVPQHDFEMGTKSGPVSGKVVLDSLRLGGVNFEKWSMYVTPGTTIDTIPRVNGIPVIGGLSSAFMSQVDMELNLAQKQVKLFSPTQCNMDAVYWGGEVTAVDISYDDAKLMVFPLEVEGKKVEASFDTHRGVSTISELVTRRFFGFDRESSGIAKEALDEGGEMASYRAMALTAKGLTMKNVRIRLYNDIRSPCDPRMFSRENAASARAVAIGFQGCFSRAPMSIGTDLLRKLRIYIAAKEGKIYFTRAEAPPPQEPLVAP